MKIIREGDLARVKTMHRFECERCGCVLEADATEYRTESDFRNGHYFVIACPTCGREICLYPEDERRGGSRE